MLRWQWQFNNPSAEVSSGQWCTLTLRAEGDRLSAYFDGKPLLAHANRTFSGFGKVALWTKADSATHFNQIRITPLQWPASTTRPSIRSAARRPYAEARRM